MPAASPKEAALALVSRLADDASFEDIQYELYVLQSVERGLDDVAAGRTVSHGEAAAQLGRWLAPEADARG
jgi:predicted transcriptional regulator